MNNPKSMVLGWVSLIAVAGVSFYFAKQNINERRRQQDIAGERPSTKLDRRERIAQDGPKAEQASRKELHSSPNPVRGSLISSTKVDAT
ncbi:hypothetical protein V8E53_010241 [Lactarius tabidus]